MGFYRFLNSKDMTDYLQAADFPFTAQQAAYLVNISTHATLAEKIEAWLAIVDEMPDEWICAGKGKQAAHTSS